MQNIIADVREVLRDNFMMDDSSLDDGASFMANHVLDSTGFLELISHLEETYGIKVLDDEMVPENLDSLDSVAAFVARKRGA